MYFPESERVIYQRNPLIQVACQLRFPPILKIVHQEPVDFQDAIRVQYPFFENPRNQYLPELSQMTQQLNLPYLGDLPYSFRSEDQRWQLFIAKDFILLTTSAYERYEQFCSRFKEAVEIFERIYRPSFYTRVGLQYQDLIVRSKLNLEDRKWSELITEHIAAELYDDRMANSVRSMVKNFVFDVEQGQVTFKHGLVEVTDKESTQGEIAYLLDADFYADQKIEVSEDVWNLLSQFNQSARRLFRWSITDVLHNAMAPRPVENSPS
jgi:uncharacterized protein (TIGR04255 family)